MLVWVLVANNTEGLGDRPAPADSMEMQGFVAKRNKCAKDIVLAVEMRVTQENVWDHEDIGLKEERISSERERASLAPSIPSNVPELATF
jgi:hypothetical protein